MGSKPNPCARGNGPRRGHPWSLLGQSARSGSSKDFRLRRSTAGAPDPALSAPRRTSSLCLSIVGERNRDERFFRWEEGRRQSFYALETNLPLFRALAEDYLIEPTSETACRFTWTIAIEPHPAARPANPASRLLLSTLFRDTRRHYGLR